LIGDSLVNFRCLATTGPLLDPIERRAVPFTQHLRRYFH